MTGRGTALLAIRALMLALSCWTGDAGVAPVEAVDEILPNFSLPAGGSFHTVMASAGGLLDAEISATGGTTGASAVVHRSLALNPLVTKFAITRAASGVPMPHPGFVVKILLHSTNPFMTSATATAFPDDSAFHEVATVTSSTRLSTLGSLTGYHMIIEPAPTTAYDAAETAAVQSFLNAGGRLFLLAESIEIMATTCNAILAALGSTMKIPHPSISDFRASFIGSWNINGDAGPLTAGVTFMRVSAGHMLQVDPATATVLSTEPDTDAIWLADESLGQGSITLAGDVAHMIFTDFSNSDFVRNLAYEAALTRPASPPALPPPLKPPTSDCVKELAGREADFSSDCPNIQYADLSGEDLRKAKFSKVNAMDAAFNNANLKDSDWPEATCSRAAFDDADLEGANFDQATLVEASFAGADLKGAKLTKANCNAAVFDGADMRRVDLSDADCKHASFVGTNLRGAKLNDGDFECADFTDALFNDKDTEAQDANMAEIVCSRTDFSKAKFEKSNFAGAICAHANFERAQLKEVTFTQADLSYATFKSSQIENANFIGATLEGTDFSKAKKKKKARFGENLGTPVDGPGSARSGGNTRRRDDDDDGDDDGDDDD